MKSDAILVFIDGPAPSEEDRALFDKSQADQFVNRTLHGEAVIPHKLALAVDPEWIPAGYTTELVEAEEEAPAPVLNPAAPPTPVQAVSLGIEAEEEVPAPPTPVLFPFGGKA